MHMKKLMFAVMGLAAVAGCSARAAGIAVDPSPRAAWEWPGR